MWAGLRRAVGDRGFGMAAVVHPDDAGDPKGLARYAEAFGGAVFVDADLAIYSALGGGAPKLQTFGGETVPVGGVLVLDRTGKAVYGWSEDLAGPFAPFEEVLAALDGAAGGRVEARL